MALQPIDLQTMYSQMANIANRVSGETQGAALSQAIQQQNLANQNIQQAQTVQRAAENQTESPKIKSDTKSSQGNEQDNKKKGRDQEAAPEKNEYEIRDPLLGQRVNVTG